VNAYGRHELAMVIVYVRQDVTAVVNVFGILCAGRKKTG
jgi:hypothetical protein